MNCLARHWYEGLRGGGNGVVGARTPSRRPIRSRLIACGPYHAALALGKSGVPKLAINALSTQTDRDEQTGLANLIKGLAGMFRNPVAHDPRLSRTVTDDELLKVMTTLSMVHRRLDAARVLP
ncbi:TIGR02391 family protein [Nocardia sp. NBC_00565]|uniref:TIGR02391 family protein n=1 Tax=Nocardia sp. NBC_00565 TaxID=2975993 RepID=UPI002E8044EB|nr:TIGR02391 family protein [Nocardia sp. NBC_00565]WUC04723.1 TIGR02391 family protein [Nocardia sp. NBC_00565]